MTDNINACEETKTAAENAGELERAAERRKGMSSFLNFLIAICFIAIGVLSVLIAFPLPRETMDYKITVFFIMELIAFFPAANITGILLTLSGHNKKSNSGIIIRMLVYIGSFYLLANVTILFFLRYFG